MAQTTMQNRESEGDDGELASAACGFFSERGGFGYLRAELQTAETDRRTLILIIILIICCY